MDVVTNEIIWWDYIAILLQLLYLLDVSSNKYIIHLVYSICEMVEKTSYLWIKKWKKNSDSQVSCF